MPLQLLDILRQKCHKCGASEEDTRSYEKETRSKCKQYFSWHVYFVCTKCNHRWNKEK